MKTTSHPGPCSRALCTLLLAASAALLAAPTASADIGYQFVPVGDPGNANDTVTASDSSGLFFGGVNYTYDIGKYDVTLDQYTTFLNAVAQTDPYGLYFAGTSTHGNMGNDGNILGISRSGSSGSYTYSVIGNGNYPPTGVSWSGNRPVAYITWFDAARFSNWLQNGQLTGLGEVATTTEQGAYTLNGATSGIITKNGNALYWIPSENEWYKAAYYDPNKGGPGVGGYWAYATKSDTAPGNDATHPTLPNQANYYNGVYSVTQSSSFDNSQNHLTDVGAFTNSASAYGTYDQTGDVLEWNDAVIGGSSRGVRAGAWDVNTVGLQSSSRGNSDPRTEDDTIGFRLASSVPEPSVAVNLIIAGGLLLARRKRPSAL